MPKATAHEDPSARAAALADENARLRGDLLTMSRRISHDLRTPLSGIGIACTALAEGRADRDSPDAALARSIAECVDEIAALIERVSFVVKASAEPKEMERVAMAEVVWAALQRLERRILKSGAVVSHPPSWPAVAGVATWLEAVWANLIANALQYAGSEPRIELGWAPDKDEYLFWIDDRGPGVPEKQAATLFESFDHMHRINAPHGLGLAIVHRLVTLQGGRCGYTPRQGGGSHFFFVIPA